MTSPTVEEARGLRGRLAFLRAASALRREPQFTPDLSIDFLRQTSAKNPFFRNAETAFFLARRGRRVAGRVAATVDRRANEQHRETAASFGYFEVADGDAEAAAALIGAAERFGRARGMTRLRGPIDLSTNHRCGLLVDGFDRPPAILMPWNPPGHAGLLEACGLAKAKDLVSLEVDSKQLELVRVERIAKRVLERGGFVVRPLDLRRFDDELRIVQAVYNAAWSQNWGFVAMTDAELDFLARGLRDVLIPDLATLVEKDGKPAAFSLAVPDVAIPIREIRGRLFPFGILKLMRWLKRPTSLRVLTLGIVEEHRNTGLDAALYVEIVRRGLAHGIHHGEFGWMLEDNHAIVRAVEACGARVTKRYRIYEKAIP